VRYDDKTDRRIPVEVRVRRNTSEVVYVVAAWCSDNGMVGHTMTAAGGGPPCSLSNLQSKGIFPKKAVAGWQHEFVEAVRAGLYDIEEVR
jgi:hypothetical protein